MHYELVSPADTGGTSIAPDFQTDDGDRVKLQSSSGQGFGGTPSYGQTRNAFVATRTSSGWVTTAMNPPAGKITEALDSVPSLTMSLSRTATSAQHDDGALQFVQTAIDGASNPLLPVVRDLTGFSDNYLFSGPAIYVGASADLDHIIFTASTGAHIQFLPGDGPDPVTAGLRLYELVHTGGDAGVLRRVDLDEAEAKLGAQCGADFGGFKADPFDDSGQRLEPSFENAISRDGSKIFFTGYPGADDPAASCSYSANPPRLFARVDGEHTVELSATECERPDCTADVGGAAYQAATPDGDRVVFQTSSQLADSDTDATSDLYLYDFGADGRHLIQASAGDASAPTPGAGAGVEGLTKLSDDGSRVYFVATGVLTTTPNALGQVAAAGAHNLYMYQPADDTTTFVAALAGSDSPLWGTARGQLPARLSNPAGDVLVFTSDAQIVPSDGDTASDVYRFDAVSGELTKVSPGDASLGAIINASRKGAGTTGQGSQVSKDGTRIVFVTAEALQPGDTNAANDVYLWTNGSVEMVSNGHDPEGVSSGSFSISADGRQIAFATGEQLVPEDRDTVVSAYVAREGQDITRTHEDPPVCAEDACQGPQLPLPSLPDPVPPLDGGIGNLPVAEPKFSVKAVTAKGRAQLAKNGSTKLSVTVSAGGAVVATARGSISKRDAVLGTAKADPTKGGVISLTLKLTKAARAELAARGKLAVKLSVTYSKVAVVRSQTLSLKKAKAAKKKAKKPSKKRASAHSVKRDLGR